MEELKKEITELKKEITELKREIEQLKLERVDGGKITPLAVKQSHLAEANKFIRGGVTADIPTKIPKSANGLAVFYDMTAQKLYIYNTENSDWDEVAFS